MTEHAALQGFAQALVEAHRARIHTAIARPLQPVGTGAQPLPPEQLQHLCNDAEELYWNELSWEEITEEERVVDGPLTEMAFPAFLSFVDGLLLERAQADSLAPARPHPDAVEEILHFLAERVASLTAELESGADSLPLVWARTMTLRLVDLVLFRLYGLSPEERAQLDALA